jgi:hypothetical protein
MEGPNLGTSERWDPDRIEVKSDADPQQCLQLYKIIFNCNLGTNNSTTRIRRRAAVTRTKNYVLRKVKAEGQAKVIFSI